MKSNFKLAPLSCHCKLSVLVQHLKKISAEKSMVQDKVIPMGVLVQSAVLFQRYI